MADAASRTGPPAGRDGLAMVPRPSVDTTRLLTAGIALTMVGVLFADVCTPLGVAVWIVYLIPLLLTLFAWRPEVPLVVGVLTSALMVIGYVASPPESTS